MIKRMGAVLALLAMLMTGVAPASIAAAKGPKYAKTEVDKAMGKCVGSVLGGALLGVALGAIVGGKKGAGAGAAVGAAGGAAICGVLIANAKRKDRIIKAQLAAAASPSGTYTSYWNDENGQPVTYVAQAQPIQTINAARLQQIEYQGTDGQKLVSPAIDTGELVCRKTSGSVTTAANGATATPFETVCRTPAGDWYPYFDKEA